MPGSRERSPDGRLPAVIQGGMGVAVSSHRLAAAVAGAGGLGVVSGVALDTVLARRLQLGDPDGTMRAALAAFPDQRIAERALARFHRPGGDPGGLGGPRFRPIGRLDVHQRPDAVALAVLGGFAEVWAARQGHDGPVGINLLEKVQAWTPAILLGAVLAGVDVALVGAGIPGHLPRILDGLAALEPVELPLDVEGAAGGAHQVRLDPAAVLSAAARSGLVPRRPQLLAIVSSHVLAAYLARDPVTRPDGYVIEGPPAGGHNAPPRGRLQLDGTGQPVYGERDLADLTKMAALGQPFWLAGGYGTPERLREALAVGAAGIQAGSVFALSEESGIDPALRSRVLAELVAGHLDVRTDAKASPTGFPFKVVALPGTLGEGAEGTGGNTYAGRIRTCDLGYLRSAYERPDGSVGYRCPAEPVDVYVRKGGAVEDTEGRLCLCNGLTATVGLGQRRPDGTEEPPLVTFGADLAGAEALARLHPGGWTAAQALGWLRGDS